MTRALLVIARHRKRQGAAERCPRAAGGRNPSAPSGATRGRRRSVRRAPFDSPRITVPDHGPGGAMTRPSPRVTALALLARDSGGWGIARCAHPDYDPCIRNPGGLN
jgi:hypothetical protein